MNVSDENNIFSNINPNNTIDLLGDETMLDFSDDAWGLVWDDNIVVKSEMGSEILNPKDIFNSGNIQLATVDCENTKEDCGVHVSGDVNTIFHISQNLESKDFFSTWRKSSIENFDECDDDDDDDEFSSDEDDERKVKSSQEGKSPKKRMRPSKKPNPDAELIAAATDENLRMLNIDPNSKEGKRQRRKIRNRMSAQLHRERKRAYIDTLEEQVRERDHKISQLLNHVRLVTQENEKLRNRLGLAPGDFEVLAKVTEATSNCATTSDSDTDSASLSSLSSIPKKIKGTGFSLLSIVLMIGFTFWGAPSNLISSVQYPLSLSSTGNQDFSPSLFPPTYAGQFHGRLLLSGNQDQEGGDPTKVYPLTPVDTFKATNLASSNQIETNIISGPSKIDLSSVSNSDGIVRVRSREQEGGDPTKVYPLTPVDTFNDAGDSSSSTEGIVQVRPMNSPTLGKIQQGTSLSSADSSIVSSALSSLSCVCSPSLYSSEHTHDFFSGSDLWKYNDRVAQIWPHAGSYRDPFSTANINFDDRLYQGGKSNVSEKDNILEDKNKRKINKNLRSRQVRTNSSDMMVALHSALLTKLPPATTQVVPSRPLSDLTLY